MKALRLLSGMMLISLSLACAGAKEPAPDGKAVDEGKAVADEGAAPNPDEAGEGAVGEAGEGGGDEAGGQACASDADCVPAECCHPTSCVIASAAPDCSEEACTEECRGGTMDCGRGHCACQDGTCTAVMDM